MTDKEGDNEPEVKEGTVDAAAAQEIGALKHQLAEAQAANEAYQKLQANTATLFNPAVDDASRQAALSEVMKAGGISEQDVRTMMSEVLDEGGEPPAKDQESQDQVTPDPSKITPHPLEGKIAELEQSLQAMQEGTAKAQQEQSKEALKQAVDSALRSSPDAAQLLTRLKDTRGQEHAEKVAGLLRKDILRETLENLYSRKAQVGQFNAGWIPEEATKAAEATLEKAKSLMVTDSVGKAPGVMDESVMLSELAKKEIKPPVFDKDKKREENVAAADDWTVQRLQQMAAIHAAKAAAGGESKA
jgi:hypothetical protein